LPRFSARPYVNSILAFQATRLEAQREAKFGQQNPMLYLQRGSPQAKLEHMNPRNTAALALVGWYLMMPPRNEITLNALAPLSRWAIADSFDSASECRLALKQKKMIADDEKKQRVAEDERRLQRSEPPSANIEQIAIEEQNRRSVCIATDDPRLKGN
jgi:hypothetical protein